jgi:dCTP deaminase
MILSDKQIRVMIERDNLIAPVTDKQINPASVNLTLGNTYLVPKIQTVGPTYLGDEVEYLRFEAKKENGFPIKSGEFVLATTQERVNIPSNIAAFVQGRSSIGRIGLATQNAGFVDPGFHGHITLELVNESPNTILLKEGYPVAQLVFFECYPVEKPYNGKYNGQVEATGSRMYLDEVNKCK